MLGEADPNDAQKQRDLSISLNKLGDVFLKLGRSDDALAHFEEALRIRRKLAKDDPNDAQKQRDLWASLNKHGDVLREIGRLHDALTQCEEGLKISSFIADADPNDVQKQRDLSVSHNNVGDVLLRLGRTEDALTQFEADLKISRLLAEADPNEAQKQRDLSISEERLGDVFLRLGRISDARTQFATKLRISRALAETDPGNAEKHHGLMVSHCKLGLVDLEVERYEDAKEHFQAGIDVLDRMIASGQNVTQSQQQKYYLEGRILFCDNASLITGDLEVLLRTDANVLPTLLSFRATELAKRGQLEEVAQTGAKLVELAGFAKEDATIEEKAGLLYNAACAYSMCGMLVTEGKTQRTEAQQDEQKKYMDLSVACLKEAIAAGFEDWASMRQDTELELLRGSPAFEALFPKDGPEVDTPD